MNNNWYTIRAIVEQCMIDLGDNTSLSRKAQYMSWAIMGYRQLQLKAYKQVKSENLPVSEINTVTLPSDYVGYVKVGVQIGDKIVQFSNNNNIATVFSLDADGNEVANGYVAEDFVLNGINTNNYLATQFWTNTFGMLPIRDFFKIDLPNNRIVLSAPSQFKTIYLEYITDGLDCIDETIVHPMAYEVIRCYVHLQRFNFARSGSNADRQYFSLKYQTAINAFREGTMDSNVQDIIDVSNRYYSLGEKK